MPPVYKQVQGTLKFEGDIFKVPEVKTATTVVGSYDLNVTVAKFDPAHPPATTTPINFTDVPDGLKVVFLVVKIDQASLKDVIKPLTVVLKDPTGAPHNPQSLTAENGKNGLVFAAIIAGSSLPFPSTWTMDFQNQNATADLSVLVQVAFGKP